MTDPDTIPLSLNPHLPLAEDLVKHPAALVVVFGDGAEAYFRLSKNEMDCGRETGCDIELADDHLSRFHFKIDFESGQYWLTDTSSTNGTCLNDRIIEYRTALVDGDVIIAGQTKFKFISGHSPDLYRYDTSLQDSVTDKLTGCYTRSYFAAELSRAIDRSLANKRPLCLLSFSIDSLVNTEKEQGTDIAHFLLTTSINRIRHHGIRSADYLGRYSNNEFILLLAGAPLTRTKEIAQRLLELFDGKPIRYMHDLLRTTLSIGIVEMTTDSYITDQLLENVLICLHDSSNSGGNCFTVFGA